jgi:hypothetical protein
MGRCDTVRVTARIIRESADPLIASRGARSVLVRELEDQAPARSAHPSRAARLVAEAQV